MWLDVVAHCFCSILRSSLCLRASVGSFCNATILTMLTDSYRFPENVLHFARDALHLSISNDRPLALHSRLYLSVPSTTLNSSTIWEALIRHLDSRNVKSWEHNYPCLSLVVAFHVNFPIPIVETLFHALYYAFFSRFHCHFIL